MLPALLALLTALGFCLYYVHHHAPAIQSDIAARAREALESARIPPAGLVIEGRDVLFKGVRGSPEVSARAQRLAESVWGANSVRVEEIPAPVASPNPPRAPALEVQNTLNEIVRLRNVEFRSGSATLTADGVATLNQVAAALAKVPSLTVSISGHTDASGDPASNQTLSEARAAVVKTHLISQGVAAIRMTTAGFGQTKPLEENTTPEGRRRNRRIEFGVTGGQAEVAPPR